MYDENVVTYISVFSKVEYVIQQVFRDYHNSFLVNVDCMKYSIIKAIIVYHPSRVIEAMYKEPENFVRELRIFLEERISLNKSNLELKERENIAFEQILVILDDVEPIISLDWEYFASFEGFSQLLLEMKVKDYELLIDKEGSKRSTVKAAIKKGVTNVREVNSKEYVGIRMTDMFIGLISKIMRALRNSLHSCIYRPDRAHCTAV